MPNAVFEAKFANLVHRGTVAPMQKCHKNSAENAL